jgi:hypothetical protein
MPNSRIPFEIYHNHQTFVWEKKVIGIHYRRGEYSIPVFFDWRIYFECDLNLEIKQYWNNYSYTLCDETKKEYNYLKEKYLDDKTLEEKNNNIFLEMTQKMQHLLLYCE